MSGEWPVQCFWGVGCLSWQSSQIFPKNPTLHREKRLLLIQPGISFRDGQAIIKHYVWEYLQWFRHISKVLSLQVAVLIIIISLGDSPQKGLSISRTETCMFCCDVVVFYCKQYTFIIQFLSLPTLVLFITFVSYFYFCPNLRWAWQKYK